MSTINAGNLKKGQFITIDGEVCQVLKTDHNYRGRGSAYMKVRLKNIVRANTIDTNFRSNDSVESIEVDAIKLSYLYKDQESLHFMDEKTFEQHAVKKQISGDLSNYLKEGQEVFILMWAGKTLGIRPPQSVKLQVTEAQDASRGNTAEAAKKIVTLETGIKVAVPLFIKKGDTIIINTDTGEYVERG